MGDKSKIEWTEATWNPIVGCTRVSEGCRNCYAERLAATRLAHIERYKNLAKMTPSGPRWTGEVRVVEEVLDQPLRWQRPRMIFVNSMSDLFHESIPDEVIDRIFAVMALSQEHTFQVLTKRPERMREYISTEDRIDEIEFHMAEEFGWLSPDEAANIAPWREGIAVTLPKRPKWPLPNVWLGVSVEDQKTADERVPLLLQTPAAIRFLSCEPLLGPVTIRGHFETCGDCDPCMGGRPDQCAVGGYFLSALHPEGVHWVIVGGESGPGARPFNLDWARSIIDQCRDAGMPVFVKQLGSRPVGDWGNGTFRPFYAGHWHLGDNKGGDWNEWPEDLRVREMPSRWPDA